VSNPAPIRSCSVRAAIAAGLLAAVSLPLAAAGASGTGTTGTSGIVPVPAYPRLRVLTRDDTLYLQQQAELDAFRRIAEARDPSPPPFPALSLFEYVRRAGEDLFSLNARLGLRYDTLATLNGATGRSSFDALSVILVPTQDGLFVNNPPVGWIEGLIVQARQSEGVTPQSLVVTRNGKRLSLLFYPNESFSGIERKFFLGVLLRAPVDLPRVSSDFGWRADPFTGQREFHGGVDLAAAEGSDVYASREGTVTETGTNATLGNYIVLTHDGGLQTVYGHLSAVRVIMNQKVVAGAVIGAVGHTGYATGPHLHYEVREKGMAVDPVQLLAMKKH
jgi:murein DD-endopeptidase MepM/ murein hydrolase activator NlpD